MHNDNDVNPLSLVTRSRPQPPAVLRGDDGHGGRRDHDRCCRQGRPGCQRRPHPAPRGASSSTRCATRSAATRNLAVASGFKEVLSELSSIGYKQIEFAGYNQHANAEAVT